MFGVAAGVIVWWSLCRAFGFSLFGLYDDWNQEFIWENF